MTCEVQNIMRGTNEGLVVIMDAAGLTIGHIARMNLMIIRKLLYYIQEATPVRLKALHILNTMPVVDKLLNIVKPFVKTELLELVSYQHVIHVCYNLLLKIYIKIYFFIIYLVAFSFGFEYHGKISAHQSITK
jgi:hypothetical protein